MESTTGGVFINYRGDDSHAMSELLHRDLAAAFGRDQVFLDCDSIPLGADYVHELLNRVRGCRVLLVVIARGWLTLTAPGGGRRIDDPADWVHREIVEAFAAGVRVVPVLIDDTPLPAGHELPADIAAMAHSQAATVRRRHTNSDVRDLIDRLRRIEPALTPVPSAVGVPLEQVDNPFTLGSTSPDQHRHQRGSTAPATVRATRA